ncbi:GIY-YIG nuclease family protein [Numidum massiliense]|uniref:GIY-YIG nuclease family protein n=1 Tax=Numidum massiliense TaxID=1522315 RepID=UPI0006D55FFC|nr:GIY-YIG nuclease family protein [Numidum massiliense]
MKEKPVGKTIQIFMPDGSPTSIKIAEITTRIVQLLLIPRNKLQEMGLRQEAKTVGLYFLFGKGDADSKPYVYIGEAENCYERLKQHHQDPDKDFWNVAVVVVSKTESFTKGHVKYLEAYCYCKAVDTGRYQVKNSQKPTEPFLPEHMVVDLIDTFETMKVLLSALGYPVFEEVSSEREKDIFYCRVRDANARGEYTDEGFVVFKGSICNPTVSPATSAWIKKMRGELLDNGTLVADGNGVVTFTGDYIFSSPSAAAAAVLGRTNNGWMEWKDASGQTLDQRKRRTTEQR